MCKNKTNICLSNLEFVLSFFLLLHNTLLFSIVHILILIACLAILSPWLGRCSWTSARWERPGRSRCRPTRPSSSSLTRLRWSTNKRHRSQHVWRSITETCHQVLQNSASCHQHHRATMHVTCDPFFTTCVFFLLFTHNTSFFLSQRNLSFLHTMLVTRREKLFVLCTLRPPLPNWGLTRPPNMPKVSPVAHDDGLCTEDAPTGSPQIGAPPTPLRWFWRGDDVAASSAAGACCCRR